MRWGKLPPSGEMFELPPPLLHDDSAALSRPVDLRVPHPVDPSEELVDVTVREPTPYGGSLSDLPRIPD